MEIPSLRLNHAVPGIVGALSLLLLSVSANASVTGYPDVKNVERALRDLTKANKRVRVVDLTETPDGHQLQMLQILAQGKATGSRSEGESDRKAGGSDPSAPAVLVVADPLGTSPLATAAALILARMLADPSASGSTVEGRATELGWYIVPLANPDAAARRATGFLYADGRNGTDIDDDKDGTSGEDPPDDLNGDGLITAMLLPHPQGSWLLTEDDPPLPKEAAAAKGEKGLYQKLTEGQDDDRDGSFNEDGPGGVVVGKNFPHAYEHWTSDGGRWAASEPESRALLEFAFAHPEIALVLVFGNTNTLAKVPESDRQVEAGGAKYKLPKRMAERIGVDPETEFDLDTLVQMARDYTGMKSLTAEDVLSFLDLGAAVNPHRKDLPWWSELSERYREFLKEAGLDSPRLEPPPSGAGSMEEWAYYQYGVPAFALDFWSVPKPEDSATTFDQSTNAGTEERLSLTPDEIEAMSRDEFIALGEEAIDALLKANDAPAHINASMVINALQGGMLTPAKIAEMIREQAERKEAAGVDPDLKALVAFSKEHLAGKGYRAWEKVKLPDGREALVGGAVPFAVHTPPAAWSDSLLSDQIPFLFELVAWLPELTIETVELDHRGADVYEVKLHIGNLRRIPYPTGQGVRCRRPPPVAITLEGVEILEGRARQTVQEVPGLGTASTRWLVRGKQGSQLTFHLDTPSAGHATKSVVLDGKGGSR